MLCLSNVHCSILKADSSVYAHYSQRASPGIRSFHFYPLFTGNTLHSILPHWQVEESISPLVPILSLPIYQFIFFTYYRCLERRRTRRKELEGGVVIKKKKKRKGKVVSGRSRHRQTFRKIFDYFTNKTL